ncbi:MAG: type II secretion system major pseudopilin GspG [Hyphomonadaceae bacterium]|nr:type II secretion system major pseudopilin GspG [Hyphomonadaceae bacterium]
MIPARRPLAAAPAPSSARLAPDAGVTLVEMMVVIVIIGLITAIVAINVLPSQETARVEKARADVRVLEQALELYRLERAALPTTEEGLEVLLPVADGATPPPGARKAGYIRRLPKDPWGRDYIYVIPGERGEFDLYSLGADAQEGGEGADADIGNW